MNRKFITFCLSWIVGISNLFAQDSFRYYHYEDILNPHANYTWIAFFESGRYEIGAFEEDYSSTVQAGMYTESEGEIALFEFKPITSNSIIETSPNSKKQALITVAVLDEYRLPISGVDIHATIYSEQQKNLDIKLITDSLGIVAFEIDSNVILHRIDVNHSYDRFQSHQVVFERKEGVQYDIQVFLEKNPLIDKSYAGKVNENPSNILHRIDDCHIEYEKQVFKRMRDCEE